MTGPSGPSPALVLGWFLAAATTLRVLYLASGIIDLSGDEAHYWEWSRRLDWSYYSKGPLIAYLMRALTELGGASALGIRLGAVLLSLGGAILLFRLGGTTFHDGRVGLLAVIGLQVTPLFWAGSLLTTIDAPFLACWVAALLALHHALVRGRPSGWLVAGLALGLGFLAKYAMLFVLPGLALYLWRAPEVRRWLRHPAPWGGLVLATVLASPVLWWNARHGWLSARHVAAQGRGSGWTVGWLAELVGSQLGVLTPLVAALLAWGAWHALREGLVQRREPYRFLAAFAWPILLFYGLLALQGKVQANWPAAAYPALGVATAGALLECRRRLSGVGRQRQTRLLAAAGMLALGVTVIGHAAPLLGLPPRVDPTVRLVGWEELGRTVATLRGTMPAPDRTFLLSDRYQVTSELAFYVPGHPPAYNVNLGRRLNQYDLWEGPEARIGWDAIYVGEGRRSLDHRLAAAFERLDGPHPVEIRRRGRVVRTFTAWRGFGYRGVARPPGPSSY